MHYRSDYIPSSGGNKEPSHKNLSLFAKSKAIKICFAKIPCLRCADYYISQWWIELRLASAECLTFYTGIFVQKDNKWWSPTLAFCHRSKLCICSSRLDYKNCSTWMVLPSSIYLQYDVARRISRFRKQCKNPTKRYWKQDEGERTKKGEKVVPYPSEIINPKTASLSAFVVT